MIVSDTNRIRPMEHSIINMKPLAACDGWREGGREGEEGGREGERKEEKKRKEGRRERRVNREKGGRYGSTCMQL